MERDFFRHLFPGSADDVLAYIVESLTHRWPAGGGGGTIRSELAMRIGTSTDTGEIYWGHIDVYEDLGLDDLARVFERWWIDVMHQAVPARILAFGLLDGGVLPGLVDDRGGLEAFEEKLELLGIHLLALAAEDLCLELFELPLGILTAVAFDEMTLPFFIQQALALLDEPLALLQLALERGDFGLQFGCGGGVDAKRFST